ncbi:MAG: hypothetical protein HY221_01095 [Candidatus Sungbacteria bacterium]|uniref:Uncharacterized protein n=1 Tax=Candidatus Sungiibacteriota bacterium TaxID=2750080 RepID=A0A932QZW7_9BACT|nr:hypothetical protein [Candidatus Sungbacteria bacterium]
MSILSKINAFFDKLLGRQKKEQEWAQQFDGKPAKPDNLIPMDPEAPTQT